MANKAITFQVGSTNAYTVPTYPVGTILYMANDASPASKYGGSWSQITAGQFIAGAGDSLTLGSTGGAETVTLTTDTMPAHGHSYTGYKTTKSGSRTIRACGSVTSTTYYCGYTGGGQAHNNLPPYVDVKIYKRTS